MLFLAVLPAAAAWSSVLPAGRRADVRMVSTWGAPPAAAALPAQVQAVLWQLAQGNDAYVEKLRDKPEKPKKRLVDALVQGRLNPFPANALIISSARSFVSPNILFNAQPREVDHVRVCDNVCGPADGTVAAVEAAMTSGRAPPLILVLGQSESALLELAVQRALAKQSSPGANLPETWIRLTEELRLLKSVSSAADESLLRSKAAATAQEQVSDAAKLNVWTSVESLLSSSIVADRVNRGQLEVHGAFLDVSSGKVSMMGHHPLEGAILARGPDGATVRTSDDPPVPAEEARTALYAGNMRYQTGNNGATVMDPELMAKLAEGGQQPKAVVLASADARCPVEIVYDQMPGDAFVLRSLGNTLSSAQGGALIGSAEYATSVLGCKCICVTGHSDCGAVFAAVQTALARKKPSDVPGSIGFVLDDIYACAQEAIALLPRGTFEERVALATKLNVFQSMKQLLTMSDSIRAAAVRGDVRIDGAVFDIRTGKAEWLGEHPELPRILGAELPFWVWKNAPHARVTRPVVGRSGSAEQALQRLQRGNRRFVDGEYTLPPAGNPTSSGEGADGAGGAPTNPFAIVLGGGEVSVPIESVFDVPTSDVIIQRDVGHLSGRDAWTPLASLEFCVAQYQPKVLLVLADASSRSVGKALDQIRGGKQPPNDPMQYAVDRTMVSALRAVRQVESTGEPSRAGTLTGGEMQISELTVELDAFYTIEQLLRSKIIRRAVRDSELELHAGILDKAVRAIARPICTPSTRSDVCVPSTRPGRPCPAPHMLTTPPNAQPHALRTAPSPFWASTRRSTPSSTRPCTRSRARSPCGETGAQPCAPPESSRCTCRFEDFHIR